MTSDNTAETAKLFRVLLFGDDQFEDIKPKSCSIGDTAKILIYPLELGQMLQRLDPKEEFFHIELLTESTSKPHAEIWLSFEWRESNARLIKRREASNIARDSYEKNKERLFLVSTKLKSFGFNQPGYAEHLAKAILANWKQGNYSDMLKTLSLADTLVSFDEEDKNTKNL